MSKKPDMYDVVLTYVTENGSAGVENVLEAIEHALSNVIEDIACETLDAETDEEIEALDERSDRLESSRSILETAIDDNRDNADEERAIQSRRYKAEKRSKAAKKAVQTRKRNKRKVA